MKPHLAEMLLDAIGIAIETATADLWQTSFIYLGPRPGEQSRICA